MSSKKDETEEFTSIERIRKMQKQFEEVAENLGEVRKLMAADEDVKIKLIVDKAQFFLDYIHPWAEQLPSKCKMKIAQAKKKAAKEQEALDKAAQLANKRASKK